MLNRIRKDTNNRKYIVLSLLALVIMGSAFFFYGCQFFQSNSEQSQVDEAPQDRRIGVLKSLGGIRTSNQGTHILELDNGDTVLLKSLQLNLDDEKYLNKTVEVSGVLNYTTDKKQIMEVMSIDVISDSSSQEMKTVSWKDYSNQQLGITIRYKDDLKVKDTDSDSVTFQRDLTPDDFSQTAGSTEESDTSEVSGSSSQLILSHKLTLSAKATSAASLNDYLKAEYPELKSESQSDLLSAAISKSKIGADSLDAYKKVETENGRAVVHYYLMADNKIYTISIETGNDKRTLDDQNIFYEMLASLKISGASGSLTGSQETDMQIDRENNIDLSSQTSTDSTSMQVKKPLLNEPLLDEDVMQDNVQDVSADSNFNTSSTAVLPPIGIVKPLPVTQEMVEGYTVMQSDSFKFSMQVPKNWFYSGTASTESGVIRHYDFGTKPLEDQPGVASMDIMTGSLPAGDPTTIENKPVVTVSGGGNITVYAKGSGSRLYKFTGPSSMEGTFLQMAASLQD